MRHLRGTGLHLRVVVEDVAKRLPGDAGSSNTEAYRCHARRVGQLDSGRDTPDGHRAD